MSDAELLADYVRGSQPAFASLVRRHVDLVYAAALRTTRDPATAEDVTQAVFVLLARKARGLRTRPTIAGWLLVTTRNVSRTSLRSAARRTRHERAAARPEAVRAGTGEAADVAPLLDEALARLTTGDRDAVALRYLEGHSFAEVGLTLGVSEEAARKRVDRAIGRLRTGLAKRGVALTGVALTAVVQSQTTTAAPPAAVAGAVAASGAKASILNGVVNMLTMKNVLASTVFVVAATAVTGGMLFWAGGSTPPAASVAQTAPSAAAAGIGEYYIGGDIVAPGAYSINGRRITIRQAITAAREPTRPLEGVRLIRHDGVETIRDIAATDIATGRDNPVLRPDDQVIINPRPVATTTASDLEINSLALELRVKDVDANLAFFQKAGFAVRFKDKPDANGQTPRASVFSGVVAIRLARTSAEIRPTGALAYFWVDGGRNSLARRRDSLTSAGVAVSGFHDDATLRDFTINTPDGYTLGFYSDKQ